MERIEATSFSTDSTNWKTSTGTNGATPGFVNSVSKKNYDYAVKRILFNPIAPIVNSNVSISCEVANLGKLFVSTNLILRKVNNDGTFTHLESKELFAAYPDSSKIYNFNYKIIGITSKQTFEVFVTGSFDEDRSNDKIKASISPGYSPQMVLLNEIMYTPTNGEPEWIELYNNSQYDIDLEDWTITDVLTTPVKTKIQAKDYIFPGKTFLVVAKDSTIKNFHTTIPSKLIISSFANLNNDADGVVLKDSRDVTIDSVRYDSFWGGIGGKSLERKTILSSSLEKYNWGSSRDIELSTPGRENSITQKRYDLTVNAISTAPQYPLLNEDVNINAKVVNYGLEQAADFTVKFYLKTNNSTTFFAEGKGINLNGGDSTWIVSNSKLKLNDNKTILCKVIFSSDEDTLNNSFTVEIRPGLKRNTVLVSEVMYDPLTGESEWIEIYNASSDVVNLKNWSISDLLPSPTKSLITSKDNFLNPGEFAIVTYDSLKYPYYPPKKFFQAKFGSLSSSDGVLIYDFRNAVIDSLKYNSGWGGAKGYS
ncbi:MAG: lamin tail domain-containing protein, partial [Ignavibacteriales bacterium]|nr:lamin tail domain-containing protein [Ignavibacteriales bacterium]